MQPTKRKIKRRGIPDDELLVVGDVHPENAFDTEKVWSNMGVADALTDGHITKLIERFSREHNEAIMANESLLIGVDPAQKDKDKTGVIRWWPSKGGANEAFLGKAGK